MKGDNGNQQINKLEKKKRNCGLVPSFWTKLLGSCHFYTTNSYF